MKSFIKNNYLVVAIVIILFIIPFFWLKPGEMDIGGDSTRLYFYDPLNFLINNNLYFSEFVAMGNRSYLPQFYFLPYVSLLLFINGVVDSPYFLVSLVNGIKLSISFLSVYLIIRTLLKNSYKEKSDLLLMLPSIAAGLLYATAPMISGNYDKALTTHDQIFLYPLSFYLFLCYFIKQKFRYLLFFIAISVIFATNFTWSSAPPFFAFFPLTLLFLFLYTIFILKQKILYREIVLALVLFLGLHAFHFIPEAYTLLSPNSYINERVFSQSSIVSNLNYFYGVLPLVSLSSNILLYAPFKSFPLISGVFALVIFLGFIFWNRKDKVFTLTGIFFLLTLYLVTANVTEMGVQLYSLFFYIPGFSMFRNFLGQWAFIFNFFYALLFGQALYILFKRFNYKRVSIIITLFISFSLVATSWSFFTGGTVNKILFQSNNVKIPMVMDPEYEQTLHFVRSLKEHGSFASFPFTDTYETVVHGLNTGAYEGPSPINWLTGTFDYNGYIQYYPFGDIFLKLVEEKDYTSIQKLLGLLNVRYIYYNSDPQVYDSTFPGNPYGQFRNIFPKTQKEYAPFIKNIANEEIYNRGTYHILKTNNEYFNSEFYVAKDINIHKVSQTNWYKPTESSFVSNHSANDAYIDLDSCEMILSRDECAKQNLFNIKERPNISFEKVNPTMYRVHVRDAKNGYLLVFSKSFHKNWNISLTKNNIFEDIFSPNILQERQFLVNGYANAWYILPEDTDGKDDYTLTVQLSDQKIFYIGVIVSLTTLLLGIIFSVLYILRKRKFYYNN